MIAEIDNFNCVIFFSYSVTVFQLLLKLQLLHILKLKLQLQLTDSDFSVISGISVTVTINWHHTGIKLEAYIWQQVWLDGFLHKFNVSGSKGAWLRVT